MAKRVTKINTTNNEETEISEEDGKINALLNAINSKVKGGRIVRASELNSSFVLRRPTGITTLDLGIGGGFPAGGFVQLVGEKNSGKTYTAFRTCATNQSIYGDKSCIALQTVEPYDKLFGKRIGFHSACSDQEIVQLNKAYQKTFNRELTSDEIASLKLEIGTVVHSSYPTAEDLLEATIDLFESNLFQIIIIDSLGSLQTEQEDNKPITDRTYGGISGPMTRFSKKLYPLLGGNNKTTVIAINQVRENLGAGPYGNPLSIPGGKALAHLSMITLLFRSADKLKKKINGIEDTEFGKIIKWRVEKGKCGCHEGTKGEFNYYWGDFGYSFGADAILDLTVASVYHDVIGTSGSWLVLPDGSKIQGKDKFAEMLSNDPALFVSIRDKVYEKAGVKFLVGD